MHVLQWTLIWIGRVVLVLLYPTSEAIAPTTHCSWFSPSYPTSLFSKCSSKPSDFSYFPVYPLKLTHLSLHIIFVDAIRLSVLEYYMTSIFYLSNCH